MFSSVLQNTPMLCDRWLALCREEMEVVDRESKKTERDFVKRIEFPVSKNLQTVIAKVSSMQRKS